MRLRLTAPAYLTAADTAARTITGMVVPYGVAGHTSIGAVSVDPGALTWPADLSRVKLLFDHDRGVPVGHATDAYDTDAGLVMAFRVARTPAGDVALLEATEQVRDALSVELDDVTVNASRITAGAVVAVAQVAIPAYDLARVSQVTATQPPPDPGPDLTRDPAAPTTPAPDAPVPDTPTPSDVPDTDEPGEDNDAMDHPAPDVTAALVPVEHRTRTRGHSVPQVTAALAANYRGERLDPALTAALADITHTGNVWAQSGQFVDEVWSGVPYTRQIVPLVNNQALTSYKVDGWRWATPPVVAPYTGDKAAVPSNAAVTEAVTVNASRLAGAHDIDRKFFDFGDSGVIASYFQAMGASYALLSDAALVDALEAGAGAAVGDGPDLWTAILVGAMSVSALAPATFALCNPDDLVAAAQVTQANAPALFPLGISFGNPSGDAGGITVKPHANVTAGTVIVGTRMAATFYELAGSPIRVEAVNLPNGGIDAGVFGYYATIVHAAGGLAKVTITPPAPAGLSAPRQVES